MENKHVRLGVLRYLYEYRAPFARRVVNHHIVWLSVIRFYRAIFCDDADIVAHHVDDHCEFCTLFGAFTECCIRGRIVDLSMRAFNRQRLDVTFAVMFRKSSGELHGNISEGVFQKNAFRVIPFNLSKYSRIGECEWSI